MYRSGNHYQRFVASRASRSPSPFAEQGALMTNRTAESRVIKKGKRALALALALVGLLLGAVAVPETSLAATPIKAHHVTHVSPADDGVGDSPIMP
jgi:hypothetical protein